MKKIIATIDGGYEVDLTEEEVAKFNERTRLHEVRDRPLIIQGALLAQLEKAKKDLVGDITEALAEGDDALVVGLRAELKGIKDDIVAAVAEIDRLKAIV